MSVEKSPEEGQMASVGSGSSGSGHRRSLALMNLVALSCLCCGLFWGFAFDDHVQGRDSAFYFFAGLVMANLSIIGNWLAWRLCPNTA